MHRKIFLATVAILFGLHSEANSKTEIELGNEPALIYIFNKDLVEHQTETGIIYCHDPQVEFNEQKWQSSKYVPEHMLVDLLLNKRLLNKQQWFVDGLFKGYRGESNGSVQYSLLPHSSRCSNGPSVLLEVAYGKEHKVSRYRTKYFYELVPTSIDSKWVE